MGRRGKEGEEGKREEGGGREVMGRRVRSVREGEDMRRRGKNGGGG